MHVGDSYQHENSRDSEAMSGICDISWGDGASAFGSENGDFQVVREAGTHVAGAITPGGSEAAGPWVSS